MIKRFFTAIWHCYVYGVMGPPDPIQFQLYSLKTTKEGFTVTYRKLDTGEVLTENLLVFIRSKKHMDIDNEDLARLISFYWLNKAQIQKLAKESNVVPFRKQELKVAQI